MLRTFPSRYWWWTIFPVIQLSHHHSLKLSFYCVFCLKVLLEEKKIKSLPIPGAELNFKLPTFWGIDVKYSLLCPGYGRLVRMTKATTAVLTPTWKDCYWCHVLEKHRIRMSKPHSVEIQLLLIQSAQFVGQLFHQNYCEQKHQHWRGMACSDRSSGLGPAHIPQATSCDCLKTSVEGESSVTQCHAKLKPGGAGIWLATWDFQLFFWVELHLKNGSRKPKL